MSTFESLRFHNYRIWFFAALIANTGSWMQRVAQDWLVLRVLTDDSASATGLTTDMVIQNKIDPNSGKCFFRTCPRAPRRTSPPHRALRT